MCYIIIIIELNEYVLGHNDEHMIVIDICCDVNTINKMCICTLDIQIVLFFHSSINNRSIQYIYDIYIRLTCLPASYVY